LPIPAHVIVKFRLYLGHCKRQPVGRLSGAALGGLSALSKDRAMISLKSSSLKLLSAAAPLFSAGRPRMAAATVGALALFLLPAVSGCSKEQGSSSTASSTSSSASDVVVARVNGTEIRQSDLVIAEEDLGENVQGMDPATKREQLVAYVTDVILVTQAAEKRNLQDNDEFKRRQAFLRNKLLMGLMLQTRAKDAVTDEEMKKVYDEAVKSMTAEEEVHALHILVETEDEAKAIVEQLKGGADFATLAKEKSKDPGAADGGDLGYFVKGQMVPEFSEVAFKMYAGQVSNPVKTQFGWHIIKVEDKRTRAMPEFDKVKDQIASYVARKAQTEFVAQLRESAKIERLDKPATPPAAAPPAAPAPAPKQ
jgi:peptidyl-prolyl cis-trans isomerase C